jgi:hypothetical protein
MAMPCPQAWPALDGAMVSLAGGPGTPARPWRVGINLIGGPREDISR